MIVRFFYVLLLLTSLQVWPVHAQEAKEEALEIGPSGAQYLKSIRFRRIQSSVSYYDPTRPAPSIDTAERPKQPATRNGGPRVKPTRQVLGLIAVAVLGLVLYVTLRFSGSASLSGRSTKTDVHRPLRASTGNGAQTPHEPTDLRAILSMNDRRDAIVALAQNALTKAARANDLLLQRSWTARDALGRLALPQDNMAALRALVHASERVHFGQRDISEEEFKAHVEAIRPLYSMAAA